MSTHNTRGHRRRRRPSNDPGRSQGPKREHIEELHPVDNPPEVTSFEEWDLGDEIQRAIRNMDITVPTPIQALAIGSVLEGKDVIAKAETGTGKTLAFGAPMMARIDPARSTVLSLVLCPTRELAQQVCDVISALALPRGVRVAFVVGGDPMQPQVAALQAGAQVVVGTPGRVLDLYQQRFLSFPWAESIVLDEADKMFEIGFLDDIKKILSYFPEERQTLLFSATFPTEVLKLARSETTDPVEIATKKGAATVTSITQLYIKLNEEDRVLALTRLFEQSDEKDVFLVFCDRRTEVDRLLRRLERLPFSVKALHGGYDQPSRYRVMSAFRTGEVKALLATDVASRGLDVEHVSHVINYSVPRDSEDYTHRIGRTGRAGRTGTAITFVTPTDGRRWRSLTSQTKFDIEEMELPQRHGRGRQARRPERDSERDSRGERPERRPRRRDEEREGEASARREERPRRGPRRERDDDRPRRERPERPERPERTGEARPAEARSEEPRQSERAEREAPRGERPRRERRPRRGDEEPGRGERTPVAADSDRDRAPGDADRPRRRRGSSERDERGGRRPRRAPREDATRDETHEERPRRERDADSERPRRRRESARDGERERKRDDEPRRERPRGDSEDGRRGEPRRERASKTPDKDRGSRAFGTIAQPERAQPERDEPERKPRRERAPRSEKPAERRESKEPKPRRPKSDGFGAGL